ncbi:MAG: cellulase family glycosylhydrolase [Deltaproteobacteria bacterium]|nr:cellulase family glycosylhydrolase [Deltaproteobacteria bacterium]MCL5277777.1 cellulase family glycosylhydrolase [Deltaproteobacteria bacterium]
MKYTVLVSLALSIFAVAGCDSNKGSALHSMVWSDGTWLRDQQGRVIIIHGINVSNDARYPPFLPFPPASLANSFTPFTNIQRAGFNAVRLTVIWAGIEPTPGTINENYLDQIQQEVWMGSENGLLFLLDMHQDLYSQSFCQGDGAPAWACDLTGYDAGQCISDNWGLNYALASVRQSFQDFWDDKPAPDGIGLQEHYALAWQQVASLFATDTSVLGYEIMNEPFPGNYNLYTTDFETQALAPFYKKLAAAIRKMDPEHIIAFEPSVTRAGLGHDFNTGISETTFPQDFRNLIFTPHYYPLNSEDAGMDADSLQQTIPALARVSGVMKTPYIVGEIGFAQLIMGVDRSSVNGAVYMVDLLDEFDRLLGNWVFWGDTAAFKNNGIMLLDSNGEAAFPVIDVLSRPYPMLTAGTPISINYPITTDPASFTTTAFTYTYKEDGIGHGTTEIFIPKIHFPNGFTVTTSDGTATFDAAIDVLNYTKGPLAAHTITVSPCNTGNPTCISW